MGEKMQPFTEVIIGEERVPVSRDNLYLYRHIGVNAIYDHCYVAKPNGYGGYIWKHNALFEKFAQLAEEHKVPMVLNKSEASEQDVEYYIKDVTQDLQYTESILADWAKDKTD